MDCNILHDSYDCPGEAGIMDSMGRSKDLFKKTWGEDVTSHIGTGF